jgi:hypothetical protein
VRNAIDFRPIAGSVTNVLLLYDKGLYEVINDSPYRLAINGIGGSAHIEPGAKMLYTNQSGGNAIQIQAIPSYNSDMSGNILSPSIGSNNSLVPPITTSDFVIVNEYYKEEVVSAAYPVNIARPSYPSVPRPFMVTAQFTNQAGPQTIGTIPITNQNTPVQTQMYVTGFDFDGQQTAAQQNYVLSLINVLRPLNTDSTTVTWTTSSNANQTPRLHVRLPYALPNATNTSGIGLSVDNLDNTKTYTMQLYCFFQ